MFKNIGNAITHLPMDGLGVCMDATCVIASHHVPDIGNAITSLPMGLIGTNLGWSHPTNTSAAKPFQ